MISLPIQVARLRGGVKRAAVKADDEDDEDEDDEADGGSKISSFVTGTFKNVSSVARVRSAAVFTQRASKGSGWRLCWRRDTSDKNREVKYHHDIATGFFINSALVCSNPPSWLTNSDRTVSLLHTTHMHLQMPPATRIYILMLIGITAVDVSVGKVIDSANTFSLDWERTVKVTWIGDADANGHARTFFSARFSTRVSQPSGEPSLLVCATRGSKCISVQ